MTTAENTAVPQPTPPAAPQTAPQPIVLMPGEGEQVPFGPNMITYKAVGKDTGGGFSLIEYSVAPHFAAPPAYFHTNEIWAAYILEGSIEFQFGERTVVAPAGAFVMSPREVASTWSNPTDQPAKWLIIFAPAGFEQMYLELAAIIQSMPPGPFDLAKATPLLLPVWNKYGVHYGPNTPS